MASKEQKVLVNIESGVALVTLNRPEVLNAMDTEVHERLRSLFEGFASDKQVRAAVITGAGRAFSAGGDISGMRHYAKSAESWKELVYGYLHPALRAIVMLEKPVIAMVNGIAAGAGFNLALACDIVVVAEEANSRQAFIKLGTTPDWGGAYFLPRLIGPARARELLFTNRVLSARDAERIGLVNKVLPRDQLETTVMAMARDLAEGPTKALGLTKMLIKRSMESDFSSVLEAEAQAAGQCIESRDYREGTTAFAEKRQPRFVGE